VLCGPRGLPWRDAFPSTRTTGTATSPMFRTRWHITGPKTSYGFTPLTGDFDNDGWPDIYVACDSTPSLYFHNLAGKNSRRSAFSRGIAYNEDGREQAGMGVTAAELSGSGLLDIFKT